MTVIDSLEHLYKWYRKRSSRSQFVADLDGEHYKTKVTVDNVSEDYLLINSYSPFGFRLNNGVRIIGPCALFPRTVLQWNITGAEDIHMHSLSLFTALEPKLDLLIIGVGEPSEIQYVNKELYRDLKNLGIGLELLSTHNACATFNYLNSERRCVAAALFPPKKIVSRNIHEFLIPDGFDTEKEFTKILDLNVDPETGKKIVSDEEIEEFQKRLQGETLDYWDHGVPKRTLDSQSEINEHKQLEGDKRDEPKLPDGKTKS